MAIDFEAEGLLDGLEDERARQARLELLRSLAEAGFSLEELRQATAEGRLAMLPVERVLAEEPRYTQRDLSELTGLELDVLAEARRAVGAPAVDPDERVLTEDDLELAQGAAALLQAGLSREQFLDLTRLMSRAMANVAAGLSAIFGEALLRPGDTERDLGLRYAESLQNLGPLAAPTLGHMLNLHLRETLRNVVVGEAELRSGRLPGAQPITVGFVDIVGFTQLGEEIPPEELGALVREFERAVERVENPPVRLVKTIGDAAMLVAPDAQAGAGRGGRPCRGVARRRARCRCCAAASRQGPRCSAPATGTGGRSTSPHGSPRSRAAAPSWRPRTCTTRQPTATPGRSRATAASRAWPARRRCTACGPPSPRRTRR